MAPRELTRRADRWPEPWRTLLSASQRGDIPNLARTVLYEFGVPRAPINVDMIAERLGIRVRPAPSSASWYGAAQADDDGATIWLREDLQEPWRRFTLAHELGHVLLHDTTTAVRDIGFSKGGIEGEATRFATALLVPATIFEEMLGLLVQEDCAIGRRGTFRRTRGGRTASAGRVLWLPGRLVSANRPPPPEKQSPNPPGETASMRSRAGRRR